jgi:hypothetical protein
MELNKLFTYATPAGTISNTGIELIQRCISRQNLQSAEWKALNPTTTVHYLPVLPEDWQWLWKIQRGEYAGTMPKRVSQYYYKVHNLKSPDKFLEDIGNLARPHSHEAVTYRFDFVDRIDWESGDFGDDGSCWWWDSSRAREMLEDNGGLAVRFFDDRDDGYGRAWIVEDDKMHIVFNGYGFPGNATLTIARILAAWMGVEYKKIGLQNEGTASGALWIDSGIGYVLGKTEDIARTRHLDLGWEELYGTRCENCGTGLMDDQVLYGADDLIYCEHCYYERFDSCSYCGETYWKEDITAVDYDYVCQGCLERHYTICDGCGDFIRNADVHYDEETDTSYCETCHNQADTPPEANPDATPYT